MYERSKFLVAGCTQPTDASLEAFYATVREQHGDAALPDDFQVRWIGGDANSTRQILDHIRSGNKTGTVSVPQAVAGSGQTQTAAGDAIVLIDFDGTPDLLVRVVDVETVAYGNITEKHTGLDGPRVRALDIWKPLHVRYFDMLLAPYGLSCTDQTPIAFETFELVHAAPEHSNNE